MNHGKLICKYLLKNKETMEINSHLKRNEGYLKSKENDLKR